MKSCMLFCAGSTIIQNGIDCDFIKCAAEDVEHYLANGYFLTPEEVYDDSSELTNEEVRQLAKDAGIENWEKARIATLKEALNHA